MIFHKQQRQLGYCENYCNANYGSNDTIEQIIPPRMEIDVERGNICITSQIKKRATNNTISIIMKIAPLYTHTPYFGLLTISPKERIIATANIDIINETISQIYKE